MRELWPSTLAWKRLVHAQRSLLLAKDVQGRGALCQKILYLPTCQESLTAQRPLLSPPRTSGPLGGCEHGFHHGFAKDAKAQRFYHGGGGLVLKNGPLHGMSYHQ